jgi:hypothetical protein
MIISCSLKAHPIPEIPKPLKIHGMYFLVGEAIKINRFPRLRMFRQNVVTP